ncbi:hypothetical protein GLOIN_2v1572845 [Rhizophagus irregularis DAOM 181602=DAOM 197198]|nr:hypothetical protein GLOIN_2v1572845 [Rhizophagus irregularis DAOM 181602=DAOM 197198]
MWLFPYTRFSLFKLQFQVHTLKAIKRIAKHSGSHVRNPRSSQVRLRPYSNTAAMAPLNLNASLKGKFLFHTSPIKSQKQIIGNFPQ